MGLFTRTIGRCKTCKHWSPNPSGYGLRGAGKCEKAPQVWDVAEYDPNNYHVRTLRPEHAGVLAVVEDGSAYCAELITMGDFGCVQHEAKR